MGSLTPLIPILLIAVIIIGAIAAAAAQQSRRRHLFERLATATGGHGSAGRMTASFRGRDYHYRIVPGGKNRPPAFVVTMLCPSGGEFRVVKESRVDAFFRNIGISCEIQTGDTDFDDRFYILTDAVGFTSDYFRSARKRDAVRSVFDAGFTEIRSTGAMMELIRKPFTISSELDPSFLTSVLPALEALVSELPVRSFGFLADVDAHLPMRKALAFSVVVVGLVAAPVAAILFGNQYRALDSGALFLEAMKYGGAVFLVYFAGCIALLRGRSSSHRDLGVILLLSLFSFPFGGMTAVEAYNGYADTAPANIHHVVVVNRSLSRGKNSTSYYAQVASWRGENRTERIPVNRSVYDRLQPGATKMLVTTKPGRLGFEWLVGYEIEE